MSEIEQLVEAIAIPDDASDDQSIFRVPDDVSEDARLAGVYHEVVRKLRDEAKDIPMTTVQHLLIERIASMYVTIKHHEENGTFLPRQQREYNQQFLAMAAEFNKLLIGSQEMRAEAMMEKIRTAIIAAANRLPDPEMRGKMKEFLAEEFQRAGL